MNYKVVIIEDEKHQQDTLVQLLLELHPELNVIGIASSVDEGRGLLALEKPDLVFLDVLLPPHTSFELLASLKSIFFEIIFTTSFEEYAVKAFRLSAVDYLVKPIVREELMLAVEKFKQRRKANDATAHIHTLLENIQHSKPEQVRVALPTFTGFVFVRIKDIIRCESDNTYTTFFTTDKKKIIVSKTLKDCEYMLVDYGFCRVHNSHLINMDYIAEYTKGEGGSVKMTDGSNIDVSRRRKDEFLQLLKKI